MSGTAILLVDDHPVVREGYRRLLERQPGFRVAAEAETAAQAYEAYRRVRPDVVVMDLNLPGAGGLEALRHIRQWDARARILVFTMHDAAAYALKAFEAGAAGYVTKSSAPADLVRAVARVAAGGRALSDDIAREIAAERLAGRDGPLAELGTRETEILRLLAAGHTTEAIADALCLSPKTIQNYHSQIKAKLGARTDAQLVWLALGAGLVGEGTRPA
ncbi:response regulator [Methylobacterium oryzisoli]|uniref:response regulator n=1 Tax=Methylobacterium oryzisoli TaxID=3385502 RepID=UPI003892C000